MTRSNLLPALFAAFAAVAFAAPADAARVKQVRVGDHPEYTRIVVELDGPAGYSVDQKAVAGVAELVVGLEATTTARIITSNSRLVEHVALRPGPSGAEAHIQLRAGAVHVKEMVLKSPHRIVLDISPAPSLAAALSAAAATPKPAPKAAPTKVAATPKPAPKAAPKADASTRRRDIERQLVAKAKGTEAPTPPAKATGSAPPPPSAAAGDSDAKVAAAATGAAARAGADPAKPKKTGAAKSERKKARAAKAASERKKARAAKAASERKKARAAKAAPAPPSLIERLGGGDTGVGLSVVLGGVAFLLAAFLLLRRRSRRAASDAAAAPWPPPGAEDGSGYVVGAESAEAESAEAESAEEEPSPMTEANAPLFAATERDEGDDEEDPVMELPQALIDAEPEVVAKADSPEIEELERRIERLEARLTDSLDARERLERQLAAHTEELRVQRAAIARTQRAVRAAVRGPESAEQPAAQRVPSQVPSPQASTPESGGNEG